MVAQVITVDPDQKLQLAGSQDDIDAKTRGHRSDHVGKIDAQADARKKVQTSMFEGTPVSYTAKPFLITMKDGALMVNGSEGASKKPPVHRTAVAVKTHRAVSRKQKGGPSRDRLFLA